MKVGTVFLAMGVGKARCEWISEGSTGYIYIYTYIYLYLYIYMYIYIYVCVCVCV